MKETGNSQVTFNELTNSYMLDTTAEHQLPLTRAILSNLRKYNLINIQWINKQNTMSFTDLGRDFVKPILRAPQTEAKFPNAYK